MTIAIFEGTTDSIIILLFYAKQTLLLRIILTLHSTNDHPLLPLLPFLAAVPGSWLWGDHRRSQYVL
jgi:hypothetical protein